MTTSPMTEDQALLRDTTTRFLQQTFDLRVVRELAESGRGTEREYLRRTAELGWFANFVPEEHGGGSVSGEGVLDAVVVAEARGRLLQPGPFVPMNVVAYALAAGGSDEHRAKLLPALASAEATATWAVADIHGEWCPAAGATVRRSGTGVVLSGRKGLVQDGHLADHLLVTAGGDGGVVQVLVPADAPGVTARRLDGLDLTRDLGEVSFDDVELPAQALVGGPDDATALVDRQLDLAAVLTMAESVGAMDELFTLTLSYAQSRIAFGRPIGSFQAIKHLLADTSLLLEASWAAVTGAARSVQERRPDAAELASVAKAFVGDSGISLAQNCFQVFGGIGYTWEHDQHLYLRRLTTDAALYGSPSWHRDRLCRMHGFGVSGP
jgi:alkylation response protein AidB-like acyl-CoA dehydrogenase